MMKTKLVGRLRNQTHLSLKRQNHGGRSCRKTETLFHRERDDEEEEKEEEGHDLAKGMESKNQKRRARKKGFGMEWYGMVWDLFVRWIWGMK